MGFTQKQGDKPYRVYRHDHVSERTGNPYSSYSLRVSSKDQDGNWINNYMPVEFKYGTDIPNKADILIKDAFFLKKEWNGNVNWVFKILDFDIINQPAADNTGDWLNVDSNVDEELPFK